MSPDHVSARLLERYADGGSGLADDVLWAVEAHLETCAGCRGRLGGAVARRRPETVALLDRVQAGLATRVPRSPTMPARRRLGRRLWWSSPALVQRVAMTVLVVAVALALDLVNSVNVGPYPSLLLLVAPVAPLLGVAAAWSRALDPAHELVVASPRAGLYLVLRRTLAVLIVVIPVLAIAGWLTGIAPALWLLPCLAFTAAALALGLSVGLHRAATGLVLLWGAVVVAPSVLRTEPPPLLTPQALPAWAGLSAAIAVVLVLRRRAYTQLLSGR